MAPAGSGAHPGTVPGLFDGVREPIRDVTDGRLWRPREAIALCRPTRRDLGPNGAASGDPEPIRESKQDC